jgi:hypothetical protein
MFTRILLLLFFHFPTIFQRKGNEINTQALPVESFLDIRSAWNITCVSEEHTLLELKGGSDGMFFFLHEDPIYLQAVIIHSANGGKS